MSSCVYLDVLLRSVSVCYGHAHSEGVWTTGRMRNASFDE